MKSDLIYSIFAKIPTLETERLIMTKMEPKHYLDMYEYASQPVVTEYLLWAPHDTPDFTKKYLKQIKSCYKSGNFYDWALIYKDNGKMIGTCGFVNFDLPNAKAEIGYVLNPSYWGQGIAAEALRRALLFGFEKISLNRIEARFMRGNERSLRVMEKAGMSFEGYARQEIFVKEGYCDIGKAAIIKSDLSDTTG